MNRLKIAYFGSPDFSADFLEKLITDDFLKNLVEVKFAVTQPDRKIGRKQLLSPTPVKRVAFQHKIKVLEIENLKLTCPHCYAKRCRRDENLDLALVYAFGKIIPSDLLALPKYGFWCVHPSLLPAYRGPSPIAYPLILGDKKTGVTIFQMDEKIDHGPIIAQEEYEILSTDKRPDLEIKLTDLSFGMFKKLMGNFGIEPLTPQNHKQATYTRLLNKSDGYIPFDVLKKALNNEPFSHNELPEVIKEYFTKNPNYKNKIILNSKLLILNLFRAFSPWPGLWTLLRPAQRDFAGQVQKRLKITDLDIIHNKLVIKKVQLEGKHEVDFTTFNKAYKIL